MTPKKGLTFYGIPALPWVVCLQLFIVHLLDKLDGIRPMKRRREESPPFLPSDDDDPYDEREEDMRIGKKRVSSDRDT